MEGGGRKREEVVVLWGTSSHGKREGPTEANQNEVTVVAAAKEDQSRHAMAPN